MTEREQFEAWMKSRGTSLVIEHPQAFEAWVAAKSIEREACARLCEKMAEARFADYGTREHAHELRRHARKKEAGARPAEVSVRTRRHHRY